MAKLSTYVVILTKALTHRFGENTLVVPYKSGDSAGNFAGNGAMVLVNGGRLILREDTDTFTIALGASSFTLTWKSEIYNCGDTDDLSITLDIFAQVYEVGSGVEVPGTRKIFTTAPLTGGGDLSADRTIAIAPNGITGAELMQAPAVSVLGRAPGTAGNMAPIQATSDGVVLGRFGGILKFQSMADAGGVPPDRVVATVSPLSGGGVLANDLTLSLDDSGVTPGAYGDGLTVAAFQVDEFGRITAAANVPIVVTPSGGAGGDLTGTFPNPTIAANAVSNAKFRQSVGTSIVGRATNTAGNVSDIAATIDGTVLGRVGGALGFQAPNALGLVTTTTQINTTAPLAGGGPLSSSLTLSIAAGGIDTAQLADNSVTNGKLRDSAGVSVIGRSANSSGDPADIVAGANNQILARLANVLGFADVGAVVEALTAELAPALTDKLIVDRAGVSKSATIQKLLDTTGLLTEELAPDLNNDFLTMYSASGAVAKKVKANAVGGGGAGGAGPPVNVRLDYVSSSVIRLNRCNGSQLIIDNVARTMPSAGVDLAPTGLTPTSFYYIYALWTGTTVALEASASAYVVDSRNGIRVKTGDASRTLVGMAYVNTGPAWIYTSQYIGVRSYYNDPGGMAQSQDASGQTLTSTSIANVAALNCAALVWANEVVTFGLHGECSNNTVATTVNLGVGIDSTTAFNSKAFQAFGQTNANYYVDYGATTFAALTEGWRVFYLVGSNSGSSTTTFGVNSIIDVSVPGARNSAPGAVVFDGSTLPNEVRLDYVSTTVIRLNRCNGYRMIIDNAAQIVPAAGVDLAPTGLTVNALYYIYAYMNAGVMTLEASATGHSLDTRNGLRVKTGDQSRTLVGMASPTSGPTWLYTSQFAHVRSYYNDAGAVAKGADVGTITTPSSNYVQIGDIVGCLSWAGEIVTVMNPGSMYSTVVGSMSFFGVSIDGGGTAPNILIQNVNTPSANYRDVFGGAQAFNNLSEGRHLYYLCAKITGGGTLTFEAGNLCVSAAGVQHGTPASAVAGGNPVFTAGRFDYVSTSICRLSRYNGYLLTIDNQPCTIPSTGVDLAVTGLTVSTTYYIYAWMNAGVMTLEASTTAYAVDARNGVKVKSGDPTRSLVGMARPYTGPAWQSSATFQWVISYYNRKPFQLKSANALSSATTTPVDVTGYVYFLIWADADLAAALNGYMYNTLGGASNYAQLWVDETAMLTTVTTSANASFWCDAASSIPAITGFSEGMHYADGRGNVGSGAGFWQLDINVRIMG